MAGPTYAPKTKSNEQYTGLTFFFLLPGSRIAGKFRIILASSRTIAPLRAINLPQRMRLAAAIVVAACLSAVCAAMCAIYPTEQDSWWWYAAHTACVLAAWLWRSAQTAWVLVVYLLYALCETAQAGLTFFEHRLPLMCTVATDVAMRTVQMVCVLLVHLGHALDDVVCAGWSCLAHMLCAGWSFLAHMLPLVRTAAANVATWSHTGLSSFLALVGPLLCVAAAGGRATASTAVSAMAKACPLALGLARQATIHGMQVAVTLESSPAFALGLARQATINGREVAAALESSPGLVFIVIAGTSIAMWWEKRREKARASAAGAAGAAGAGGADERGQEEARAAGAAREEDARAGGNPGKSSKIYIPGWIHAGAAAAKRKIKEARAEAAEKRKAEEARAAAAAKKEEEEAAKKAAEEKKRKEEAAAAEQREEEMARAKRRQEELLAGLRPALDRIHAAATRGSGHVIRHVFATHPPKGNEEMPSDLSDAGCRFSCVCSCCARCVCMCVCVRARACVRACVRMIWNDTT